VVSAYRLIGRLWREEEKCGFSEIQLFKLPILALPVVKKSGYKDILKQKLVGRGTIFELNNRRDRYGNVAFVTLSVSGGPRVRDKRSDTSYVLRLMRGQFILKRDKQQSD